MEKKYDVIVIGAGIAGITAAIYLKRFGYNIIVVEKNYPGGQLNKIGNIENYPGFINVIGSDLANFLYEQAKNLEIPFLFSNVNKIDIKKDKIVETTKDTLYADNIIIATGRTPKKLDLENEEELIGKGISYCATCDGNFFKDKVVSVVGGGESAVSEAIYLSSIAKKVNLFHRRNEFKASKRLVDKLKSLSNINIYYNSNIVSLNTNNGILSSIKYKDKKENTIETDGLFIYIGSSPSVIDISDKSIYTEDGYIIVDKNYETKLKGIYACGDVIKKDTYQLTTAVGEATLVANNIHKSKIKKC